MKLMINEESYDFRLNKLLHKFPLQFLIVALIVVYLYHVIMLQMNNQSDLMFSSEILANTFLQGTIATALVYFVKSYLLRNVFKIVPTDFTTSEVLGYLPCVDGTWIHQYQAGFLVLEKDALKVYVKKVDGFKEIHQWPDISKVKISIGDEKFNISSILLFGQNESIVISDGKTSRKILFPMVRETVSEMNTFLETASKII